MWHKLISPFVGLLIVLTMSSCSGDEPADKTTSTPSDATTSVAPVENDTLSPDEEFINQLHVAIPGTDQGNEADYIRLAKEFCSFLDEGYTPQGIVMSWASNGGRAKSASTMLQIAVPIYCPQHTKVVEKNLS